MALDPCSKAVVEMVSFIESIVSVCGERIDTALI